LNTPPAFILSQNQTLRKNNLICCSVIADRQILNRGADLKGRLPRTVSILFPMIDFQVRSAQFNLFPLLNKSLLPRFSGRNPIHFWHAVC
ncbi:MAG: hypothetical protein ABI600_20460, partial [Luteolibacter sp.]